MSRVSIFPMLKRCNPSLFLLFVLAAALTAPGPASAELKDDPNCRKPAVKSKASYGGEKIVFDLASRPGYRTMVRNKKILGWYDTNDWDYRYEAKLDKGCIKTLDFTIHVRPVIALLKGYKKKNKACARSLIIQHERLHHKSASEEFKRLAKTVKKMLAKHFTGKAIPGEEDLKDAIAGQLSDDFIAKFNKKVRRGFDAFHRQLAQAKYVKKKCKLVKR